VTKDSKFIETKSILHSSELLDELEVNLNTLIANLCISGCSSPYDSHHYDGVLVLNAHWSMISQKGSVAK